MNGVLINVVGNVTRDPQLQYSGAGKAYVRFGIAVNRIQGQGDNRKESTAFFDVTAFGDQAENIAESISKGSRVVVSGTMEVREWDKADGSKGTGVGIVADEVAVSLRFGAVTGFNRNANGNGSNGNGNGSRPAAARPAPTPAAAPAEDRYSLDEEPF